MAGVAGTTTTAAFGTSNAEVNLKTCSWSGVTVSDIEITNNSNTISTSGGTGIEGNSATIVKQYAPGPIDWGTISCTGGFDPVDVLPMTGTTDTLTITLPKGTIANAGTLTCTGYVNDMSVSGLGLEEEVTVEFSFKLNDTPTYNIATA